jgi:hypothetical protein
MAKRRCDLCTIDRVRDASSLAQLRAAVRHRVTPPVFDSACSSTSLLQVRISTRQQIGVAAYFEPYGTDADTLVPRAA